MKVNKPIKVPRQLEQPEARSSTADGFAAGLVLLRAAGLEPSDYAKELAAKVVAGEISGADMEAALLQYHGIPDKGKT